jgi:uncharacterized protein GlcG (DUF336 family)
MTDLTLDIADRIATGTLAAGASRKAQPLTVVVLDAGGHVVVAKRADGSGILRIEIATGKAYGALGFGLPSRVLFKRAADNPNFFNSVAMASGGRLVPNAGGVLLRNAQGHVVGAVGVSGDTADMDEDCALDGIMGCGLIADAGRD